MSELNEKERENLPDREIAEKNSVYKVSEEANEKYLSSEELLAGKKQEAPARKIAEKNSVYKIAEEAGEKYGHEADRALDATQNNYNNQSGSQSSSNTGRQGGNSRGNVNNDTGSGGGNSRSNRNDDTGIGGGYDPGAGGNKDKAGTNSLRETVKLDNDTFDGRSKLDGTPGDTWDDPKAMEGAMASAPRDKKAHRIPPAQQGQGQGQKRGNPTDYDKFTASEVPARSNAATDRNTYDFNDTLADETTEQARNRRQRNQ